MSVKGAGADRKGDIKELSAEISQLRASLADKEQRLRDLEAATASTTSGLSNDDIARYSRQLILPRFGVSAQLKLKHSAFLIVGLGGLGCPAAQYLLAAGCGRLGLVDYDEVERSNFHRQTLHTEARIGLPKVESARQALAEINPGCQIATHRMLLNSENALELIADYDVVLDCTDNVATRYLLNDACVMLRKPLVSGSALQLDGQLTVYGYGETGPCFRCIFPVPPPPETVTNCSDAGVLGAVTGVIGSLQALEAIKVAVNVDCGGDDHNLGEVLAGRLLIFSGARCLFRNLKLRPRRDNCNVCSAQATITRLIDYEQFCGMRASDKDYALTLLAPDDRLQVQEYARTLQSQPHLLIDVRAPAEFQICRLPGAINVPLKQVLDDSYAHRHAAQLGDDTLRIVVLCRRGNDSQLAVEHLRSKLPRRTIHDLIGGLHAWHYKIDGEFPIY